MQERITYVFHVDKDMKWSIVYYFSEVSLHLRPVAQIVELIARKFHVQHMARELLVTPLLVVEEAPETSCKC